MKIQKVHAATNFEVPAAIVLSVVVQTMISLFAAGIPILAPVIAAERAWNPTVIAFYPTVVYVTAFLFSFRVPELLVRLGGMGLSLACIAISAAGILFLLPPYAAAAALAAIAIGCATGAMNPASAQVLGPRTSARTAGFVMSIKQTGVPFGGVVAGALIPHLALHYGWRATTLTLAAVGSALVLVLLPSVRWLNGGAAIRAAFRPLDPVKKLFAMPGMPSLLQAGATFAGMQLCLRSFFALYLVTNQRSNLVTAGIAFSVSQAAGMIGQIFWATLSDRLLSVHIVMAVIGSFMTAATFCTVVMTPQWPLSAIMLVAATLGLSAAGFLPVLLGEVARRSPPGQIGALTSGAQLFPLSGSIFVPLAFGGMAFLLGMPAAFVLAGAFTLASTIILVVTVSFFSGSAAARNRPRSGQI